MESVVSRSKRMPLFPRLLDERSLRSGFCARYVLVFWRDLSHVLLNFWRCRWMRYPRPRRSDNIEGVEIGYEIGCECMRKRQNIEMTRQNKMRPHSRKSCPFSGCRQQRRQTIFSSPSFHSHWPSPRRRTKKSEQHPTATIQNGRAADSKKLLD